MRAFDEHAAWPDLPRILPSRLKKARFDLLRCEAVPFVTLAYHPNTFVYGLARLIHQFVTKNTGFAAEEADAWLNEFDDLEKQGAFFYRRTVSCSLRHAHSSRLRSWPLLGRKQSGSFRPAHVEGEQSTPTRAPSRSDAFRTA